MVLPDDSSEAGYRHWRCRHTERSTNVPLDALGLEPDPVLGVFYGATRSRRPQDRPDPESRDSHCREIEL